MPRRKNITQKARNRLRGPRRDLSAKRPRWYPPKYEMDQPRYRLPDGQLLNIPESKIAFALIDLHVNFEAQKPMGPSRRLGGALVDFFLPDYGPMALEFQGVFHFFEDGASRDFWREVTRKQYGISRVENLYDWDLPRIHNRLREILGIRSVAQKG